MGNIPGRAALLDTALEAAEAGAEILLEGFVRRSTAVRLKGPGDPVTKYDEAAEEAIRAIIARDWPDHDVLGEEGGLREGARGGLGPRWRWYIDPLDGTRNYARRLPAFCVSIGFAVIDPPAPPRPHVGVVLAPVTRELFWGAAGRGAFLRQELPDGAVQARLRASKIDDPAEAVAVVGQPYDFHERPDEVLGVINRLAKGVSYLRHSGSAALDLCYVAAGRLDAYVEPGLKAWDVAAGAVILAEAGGVLTDLAGRPFELEGSGDALAAAPRIHGRLAGLVDWRG